MRQDPPIAQSYISPSVRNADVERRPRRLMDDDGSNEDLLDARSASRNSAVMAGWICAGLGLLTAWLFPPCHVFFAVAVIMAIVAMATRQVTEGLALLLCSLLGAGICAAVFFALVTGTLRAEVVSKLSSHSALGASASDSRPSAPAAQPRPPVVGTATAPLALNDVALMLRSGWQDDEILADTTGKQLVDSIGVPQAAYLRSLGAGNRLVANLQQRPVYARPAAATSATPLQGLDPTLPMNGLAAPPTRKGFRAPPPFDPTSGFVPQVGMLNSMDPQRKQQRIALLKSQMDGLDDQIRDIRASPKNSRYWYNYYTRPNGINQRALDNYLNDLDKQRNDLRREKWQLEGR